MVCRPVQGSCGAMPIATTEQYAAMPAGAAASGYALAGVNVSSSETDAVAQALGDALDDVRWADGIAFGTPIGDGRPAGALMRFIEGMEPAWSSGWLNDKVVTLFTGRPEQIAPDSVLHPIYDVLYRWGAVMVGQRATELKLDARAALASAGGAASRLPAARLRTAQYRTARLARLAGVLVEERHRHELFAL